MQTETQTRMPNLDMPVNGPLVAQPMGSTFAEIKSIAAVMHESGLFPDCKSAAQAVVKIMAGHELGFGPFASMSGVYIILGKAEPGANMLAALVKRSGKYNYKVTKLTPDVCELDFFENGLHSGKSTFTLEDAKKADTKNIGKFPRNMLFARALTNGVKWFCPDVENGVYTLPDGEMIEQEPVVVEDEGQTLQEALPADVKYVDFNEITTLMHMIEQAGIPLEKVLVAEGNLPGLHALPMDQFDRVKAKLEVTVAKKRTKPDMNGPVSTKTIDEIAALRLKWKIPETGFYSWVRTWYKISDTGNLRNLKESEGRELLQQMKESEATLKDAAKCAAFLSQYQKGDFAQKKTAEN